MSDHYLRRVRRFPTARAYVPVLPPNERSAIINGGIFKLPNRAVRAGNNVTYAYYQSLVYMRWKVQTWDER
jgi:hypothetical protein